jgi:hypothetical protein
VKEFFKPSLLSYWQITHDHKYMMMGVDCGKWRVGVCACYLSFIVRTELVEPSGASSSACDFGGGARRKQFMTKGGGRSAPLTMILSSFLKEISLRGALLQNMTCFLHMNNLYGCRKYCFDSLHRSLQES